MVNPTEAGANEAWSEFIVGLLAPIFLKILETLPITDPSIMLTMKLIPIIFASIFLLAVSKSGFLYIFGVLLVGIPLFLSGILGWFEVLLLVIIPMAILFLKIVKY